MKDNRKDTNTWIIEKISQLDEKQLQLLIYYIKALIANSDK